MGRKLAAFLFLLLCIQQAFAAEKKTEFISLPAEISDSIPWFAIRTWNADNEPFTKATLQKLAIEKKQVVLTFFSTWCLPCREGAKQIIKNMSLFKEQNIEIIFVDVGENDDIAIGQWINKIGVNDFKVVMDRFGRMTELFGLAKEANKVNLPKTLILDKNTKPLYLLGREGDDYIQILSKAKEE